MKNNASATIRCRSNTRRYDSRRGSLYIAVVFVGAIISALALSAVLAGRIRLRTHGAISDSAVARLNAHAALRLGLKAIEDDPDWRFSHASNMWYEDRSLSHGTFDLEVVDPSDGQVSDAAADPVVLTGIGRSENAVHRTQLTLAPLYRGYDCLTSAVHAGDDVEVNSGYYSSFHNSHIISANDDVKASSYAGVNGTVEAATAVEGSYYTGTTRSGADPKTVPRAADVLAFYKNNGTLINMSDLPDTFPSVVLNGDFETDAASWEGFSADVVADTVTAAAGSQSLLIHNRENEAAGARQDITHVLRSGRACEFEVAVYPTVANQQFYFHVEVSDGSTEYDFYGGPFSGPINTWTTFTGSIQPTFSQLSSAKLLINTASYQSSYADYGGGGDTSDFRIDEVKFRESERVRNIDHVLLSPTNNPFGEVNSSGIYVIDAGNQKLVIRNSRIYGTLVLLNPASSTKLGDDYPLVMSAANSAYPVLLVEDGEVEVNPSSAGLVENLLSVNFNPPDAPYGDFGSNSDLADTFPSTIQGLIFSEEDITLENLKITGAIIGEKDIFINEAFSITWDNRFYRNPPPGFSGPEQIRLLLGSAKRVVE